MYYNTTNEDEIQVDIFSIENQTQEDLVLSIAGSMHRPFSFKDIKNRFPKNGVPDSSLKRAICDLKKKGKIMFTGGFTMGCHNKKEHLYKIRHETTKDYNGKI